MDFTAASRMYLDHRFGDVPQSAGNPEMTTWAKRFVERRVVQARIEPWQWWRLVGLKPFIDARDRLPLVPESEDPGRAWLLALGFRLVGGVSPYLLLFLGGFCLFPILVFTSWALFAARWPIAGTAFPIAVVSLPFVVENLALPYSAVAFYLIALLAIVPFAAYAVVGRGTSPGGFLLSTLACALLFGVCTTCRADVLALAPGFVLAILMGARRVFRGDKRGFMAGLGSLVLFFTPYFVMKPKERHNTWQSVWEGLGDFDETKGHRWSDSVVGEVLASAGISSIHAETGLLVVTPEGEAFFRRSVIRDIWSDPLWFAGIVLHRVPATLTLHRLRPFEPLFTRASTGTATVDSIGFRGASVQVPIWFLIVPTLLLVGLACMGPPNPRLRDALRILACPAVAALVIPILLTTNGAFETQAFALVYLLGCVLFLEVGIGFLRLHPGRPQAEADRPQDVSAPVRTSPS
jgi:hypothetical protein